MLYLSVWYILLEQCLAPHVCIFSRFSCVWLLATPWIVFHQAPLSMGFSRQEYWSGLPWPPPGDLPDPGIECTSPTMPVDSYPLSYQGCHIWPLTSSCDGWVMVERSDRMWSTGEGNGKPLQYSCLENPMNSMKRQNYRILKEELPRSVGAHYATGDQWRNNSRKNEGMEPKQKQYPVVDVTGDRSRVWCCKEKYYIGTWNVRSMNQGKLEVVKQEMARVNVDILGISKLKWTGMGEFNSWPLYLLLWAGIP